MSTLLVIDDEPNVLYSLQRSLHSDSLRVVTAETAGQGLERVKLEQPDAVILDVFLPDMSGLDAFEFIRQIDPRLPVIMITAHATTETAIEAMKRGAFEYLVKPIDLHQLRDVVASALHVSRLNHVPALFGQESAADSPADRIVGLSPAMQRVYKDIGRVAPQDVNVLILGESGTGKELVARAIYSHSRRSQRTFVAINCAALPESLLESELFGHERGAFTGADRRRIGKFEQAHQGTIFLDEIGDMTIATQAKVLRLLQDGRFERVGGNDTVETDVRLIAATNQKLEELITAGRFREDLYYRLKVFAIQVPPLRERMEDLPMLVEHFIRQADRELGKQVRSVAPETMALLESSSWPGNVRELQSSLKYAIVKAAGEVLTPDCLPESVRLPATAAAEPPLPEGALDLAALVRRLLASGDNEIYRHIHAKVDEIILPQVLQHVGGSQVLASQVLGISRTTLRARLAAAGDQDRRSPNND